MWGSEVLVDYLCLERDFCTDGRARNNFTAAILDSQCYDEGFLIYGRVCLFITVEHSGQL
jgi:hypothetical protein